MTRAGYTTGRMKNVWVFQTCYNVCIVTMYKYSRPPVHYGQQRNRTSFMGTDSLNWKLCKYPTMTGVFSTTGRIRNIAFRFVTMSVCLLFTMGIRGTELPLWGLNWKLCKYPRMSGVFSLLHKGLLSRSHSGHKRLKQIT